MRVGAAEDRHGDTEPVGGPDRAEPIDTPGAEGRYVQSLTVENTGPLQVSVYSDWKYAYEIENGRPSRDLKRMLDTSMKVASPRRRRTPASVT
jgi:hypothetical protein